MDETTLSPHRFRLKGASAEDVLEALAAKSFFVDWSFRSPALPNGNELCDFLIVFDHTAIIWQAKDLKLDESGHYKAEEVEKNLRQLSGAYRELFKLKTPVDLVNARRRKETFNPEQITEVFLVSALLGEGEDHFSAVEEVQGRMVHIFTREFTEIVLGELDTISDFVEYLRAKQALLEDRSRSLILNGGEQNLLGFYLQNNRSFARLEKATRVAIDDGVWSELQGDYGYQMKKQADRISYAWDGIIDRAHEGSEQYERVARELARPNRLERRALAQSFYDMHVSAHQDVVHPIARRITVGNDPTPGRQTTYVFLFMDESLSREQRREMLQGLCIVARDRFRGNRMVLGVATEKRFAPTCSYDFCVFDYPEWPESMAKAANALREQAGFFKNPEITEIATQEYPEDPIP